MSRFVESVQQNKKKSQVSPENNFRKPPRNLEALNFQKKSLWVNFKSLESFKLPTGGNVERGISHFQRTSKVKVSPKPVICRSMGTSKGLLTFSHFWKVLNLTILNGLLEMILFGLPYLKNYLLWMPSNQFI